jgi:quercetin dioxygenase-like cupin family protein
VRQGIADPADGERGSGEVLQVAHIRAAERRATPGKFQGSLVRIMIDAAVPSSTVTLGETTMMPGAEVPPHRHKVEEVFYVIEGSGTAIVGDEEVAVDAGDALLAPAGELHGFRNDSGASLRMVFFYPAAEVWADYPGLAEQPRKLTPFF